MTKSRAKQMGLWKDEGTCECDMPEDIAAHRLCECTHQKYKDHEAQCLTRAESKQGGFCWNEVVGIRLAFVNG